jgi:8-oxo-dGTP pyrophosphatase MutT (NUDIX family)
MGSAPVPASTLLLLRDGDAGLEVLTVVRSGASPFMAGNLVFPGGKVDPADASFTQANTPCPAADAEFGAAPGLHAFAVAACRESLEEAAVLPVVGGVLDDAALVALRTQLAQGTLALDAWLASAGLRLDLAALVPFARWITPAQEGRRYDTRFFVARAPANQSGLHDANETTSAAWSTPAAVLDAFDAGTVRLAPPTHKAVTMLAAHATVDEALAAPRCLAPILPLLVKSGEGDTATVALVLPGDPEHPVPERRAPGPTRYVLIDGRMQPRDVTSPAS